VKYLLDTNAVVAALKGQEALLTRLRQEAPRDVVISAIVAHELYFGAYKSRDVAKNFAVVESLAFEVVAFDQDDAAQSAQLRARLTAAGTPIGPYDLLIAGQALARGLTVITRNVVGFSRVPTLRVENWEG
jgi:tRNA(fMet)-specific endonuclease VapC